MTTVFSSESVTEGHPDKVADQISDAVLDALFAEDPTSRVACETLLATEFVALAGEITSEADVDYEAIARRTLKRIGYTTPESGIGCDTAHVRQQIVQQSPDIAMGTAARADQKIGAGDQGMMFGYADVTTPDNMPTPISLAHALTRRLSEVRKDGTLPYLRPDGKSQVSVRYEGAGNPVAVDALVLAAQHEEDVDLETLQADLKEHVVAPVVPDGLLHDGTKYFINHTGKFVKGGPAADAGLTGRKIIVDTYGGWVPHGGGAFSGKDPTKVDRSAAYYARFVAKNLVNQGLADRLQIQVAYSIGSLEPVSIHLEAFGTHKESYETIHDAIHDQFSFAPGSIIDELELRRPIYEQTAAYGHFGNPLAEVPWEQVKQAKAEVSA